jgi:hypothetical protein
VAAQPRTRREARTRRVRAAGRVAWSDFLVRRCGERRRAGGEAGRLPGCWRSPTPLPRGVSSAPGRGRSRAPPPRHPNAEGSGSVPDLLARALTSLVVADEAVALDERQPRWSRCESTACRWGSISTVPSAWASTARTCRTHGRARPTGACAVEAVSAHWLPLSERRPPAPVQGEIPSPARFSSHELGASRQEPSDGAGNAHAAVRALAHVLPSPATKAGCA